MQWRLRMIFVQAVRFDLRLLTRAAYDKFRGTICCFVFKKREKQLYILTTRRRE